MHQGAIYEIEWIRGIRYWESLSIPWMNVSRGAQGSQGRIRVLSSTSGNHYLVGVFLGSTREPPRCGDASTSRGYECTRRQPHLSHTSAGITFFLHHGVSVHDSCTCRTYLFEAHMPRIHRQGRLAINIDNRSAVFPSFATSQVAPRLGHESGALASCPAASTRRGEEWSFMASTLGHLCLTNRPSH